MLSPALRRLIAVHGCEKVSVVVQGNLHKKILQEIVCKELNVIVRYDGGLHPNLRLWFKILLVRPKIIYAPLLSKKFLHVIFFLLLPARVIVPSHLINRKFLNLCVSSSNLEIFKGHQVNYFLKYFSDFDPKLNANYFKFNDYAIRFKNNLGINIENRIKNVVIGISCGPNENHKIPSPSFFSKVINTLAKFEHIKIYIIGSKLDLHKINKFIGDLDSNIDYELLINCEIGYLVNRMANFDLGIAGTTGQGHMMALADLPMLVFAGVTNPRQSGPYVRRAAIASHKYSCGPCYREVFRFGCGSPCMDAIDVEQASYLAHKLLSTTNFGIDWLHDYSGN